MARGWDDEKKKKIQNQIKFPEFQYVILGVIIQIYTDSNKRFHSFN